MVILMNLMTIEKRETHRSVVVSQKTIVRLQS
nr:MAG TPA_asm: hypothetical protein [Caudoviricetes sp.]